MGYLQDFIQNARGAMGDRQFRSDVAQGTTDALNRGVIASAIGAPVDLANTLSNLLKAGVGYVGHKTGLMRTDQMPALTETPVMGSEWVGEKMRQAGMVSDKRNHLAELLAGGVLAPASSVYGAQKAPQIAAGILKAQANAAAPRTLNPQTGAIVWHGSPHKFDKFDSSKIGTGEGAQAYGHGLYLAESPDVAGSYKAALAGRADSAGAVSRNIPTRQFTPAEIAEIHRAATGSDPIEVAAKRLGYRTASLRDVDEGALTKAIAEVRDEASGSLYKVDLPDSAIARMLDWDKPLSQQAPEVQRAMQQAYTVPSWKRGERMPLSALIEQYQKGGMTPDVIPEMRLTARQIYSDLVEQTGSSSAAADALRKAGVPGVRYLDGGSRGAGQGTSNYVVFPGEEGLLQILERNGAPIR